MTDLEVFHYIIKLLAPMYKTQTVRLFILKNPSFHTHEQNVILYCSLELVLFSWKLHFFFFLCIAL